jgi:hypothetical protein
MPATNGNCIASHLPGRLRLRHSSLRLPAANAATAAELAAWPGIVAAEGRPASGSVILRYDPEAVAPETVEGRVRALFRPDGDPVAAAAVAEADGGFSLWSLNRPAKLGMLGSLGGALLALSVGKKAHAVLGAMHVAFLLVHLANHRKKILQ